MALSLGDTPTQDPGLNVPTLDVPALDRSAEQPTDVGLTRSPVNGLQTEAMQALYVAPDRSAANIDEFSTIYGRQATTEAVQGRPGAFGATNDVALEAGVPQQLATVLGSFGDEVWRTPNVGMDLPAGALARTPDGLPIVAATDGLGRTLDGVELAQAPPVGWVAGIVAEGRGQAGLFWGFGPSVSANFGIAIDDDEIAITSTIGGGVGAGGGAAFGVGAYGVFGAGSTMNDVRDVGGLGVETGAFVGAGVGVQGSAGIAINDALETAGVALGAPIGGPAFGGGAYIELQNTHVKPILNYQDLRADSVRAIQNLPQEIQDHLNTVKSAAGQGHMPTGQWLLNVYDALRTGVTGY